MNYMKLFLNKVIEDGDIRAFSKYNITKHDMHNDIDLETYKFIKDYAAMNNGSTPSYASTASEVEGFQYVPEVTDSYKWLATNIKSNTAKLEVQKWFTNGEFQKKIDEMDGREFVNEWLPAMIEGVSKKSSIQEAIGVDVKRDTKRVLDEYESRKIGESFKIWKSKYSSIKEYTSGNMYTVFGESGRGKSVITLEDGIYAAQQGANVLIWSLEMAWYEVLVRIYTAFQGM